MVLVETLYWQRCELQIDRTYQIMTTRESGERMIIGKLIAEGITTSQSTKYYSLSRSYWYTALPHWASHIKRCPYSIPGSNALWHLGME